MESHLQLHIDENLSRDEPRRSAKECADEAGRRDANSGELSRSEKLAGSRSLFQDLRFGARMLLKNPGFTATAVLILAFGIGANTAMFSVVQAVLLRPLAYSEPDRIVTLSTLWKTSASKGQVSAPDFHDWHDESNAFEAMSNYGAWDTSVTVGTASGAAAEYVFTATIVPEFFKAFNISPIAGREMTADELKPGPPGLRLSVMDSRCGISPRPATRSGSPFDRGKDRHRRSDARRFPISIPNRCVDSRNGLRSGIHRRSAHNYLVVGRLKPGVSLEQAQAQMTASAIA